MEQLMQAKIRRMSEELAELKEQKEMVLDQLRKLETPTLDESYSRELAVQVAYFLRGFFKPELTIDPESIDGAFEREKLL